MRSRTAVDVLSDEGKHTKQDRTEQQDAVRFQGQITKDRYLMEPFDFNENSEEYAVQDKYRIVICGANSYDKKYYFNKKFDNLPTNIKEELHIICVLFTEECGGVFTISFTPFGHIEFDTQHEEDDLFYDEISARLLIKEIRRKKREMLDALSIYFRVTFLHQNPADLIEDFEEDEEAADHV